MVVAFNASILCLETAVSHSVYSSSDSEYISNASLRLIKPLETAMTTFALRDATHLRVDCAGRSARVITVPFGSVTDRGPSIFFKYIFLLTP